jgi:hypothetical protein
MFDEKDLKQSDEFELTMKVAHGYSKVKKLDYK